MNGIEIESISVEDDDSIVIIAVVDNMVYSMGSSSLVNPPEYGPARCMLTIPGQCFDEMAPGTLKSFNRQELGKFVEDYGIDGYDWEIIEDDYDPRYD